MNYPPKFTIITVCYNAEKCLKSTIESVISQSYKNFEYIIIDGKSNDYTVDIIKQFNENIDNWISELDKGIYDAMNKGISVATGDYIVFMNAGDKFKDENVLSLVANQCHNYDVIFGDAEIVYKTDKLYKKGGLFTDHDINLPFVHQSSFVKLSLIKAGFDLRYKIAADYHMYYELYKSGYRFKYISEPLSIYDMNGFSSKNQMITFEEVSKIRGWDEDRYYWLKKILFKMRLTLSELIPHAILRKYRQLRYKKPQNN